MPKLSISRGGGWTDRFRGYAVLIDDVECGAVRVNQTAAFDVPAGPHQVRLRIGPYGSPTLQVEVGASDVALDCGSNVIPGLAILALARPNAWIWLREAERS